MASRNSRSNQTPDNHLIAVVLLLVFIYPLGLIFMWMWMKAWPKWLKWLLTLFFVLPIVLVIGLSILLIEINPSQQLEKAYTAQRQNDTAAIVNSVNEYKSEHSGKLPPEVTSTPTEISKQGTDICSALVPTYLSALPVNPSLHKEPITDCSQPYDTGYTIMVDSQGKISVYTPTAAPD